MAPTPYEQAFRQAIRELLQEKKISESRAVELLKEEGFEETGGNPA